MTDETSTEVVEVVPEPERLKDGYAWVYHAGLDRTIQVPDTAVPVMRGSGWDYVPTEDTPNVQVEDKPAGDNPATPDSEPQAKVRRRTSEKENS